MDTHDDDVVHQRSAPTYGEKNAASNDCNACTECPLCGDNNELITPTTVPLSHNQDDAARAEQSGERNVPNCSGTQTSTLNRADAADVAEGGKNEQNSTKGCAGDNVLASIAESRGGGADDNRKNRPADTATASSHKSRRRFSEHGRLAERLHEIDELCASLKRRCSTLEGQRNQVENELASVRDVYETQLLKLPKKDDFSESLRDRVVQLERQRQHDRQLLKKQDAETKALRLEVKSQVELIESMRLHREHLEREIQNLENTLEITSQVHAVPENSNSNSVNDARSMERYAFSDMRSLESCVPPPSMVLAGGRAYLGSRREGSSGDEPGAKSELIKKIPPQSSSSSNSLFAPHPAHPGSSLPSLHIPLILQTSPTGAGRAVATHSPQFQHMEGDNNAGTEKRAAPPLHAVTAPETSPGTAAMPPPAAPMGTPTAAATAAAAMSASHSPTRNKKVPLKTNATPKVHPVPRREGNGAQGTPRSFGGYSPMYGIGALASSSFSPMCGMPNLVPSSAFSPRAPLSIVSNVASGSSSAPTTVAAHVITAVNAAGAAASPAHVLPSSPSFHRLDSVRAHAPVNSADADAQIAHLESLMGMLAREQQLMRDKQVLEDNNALHPQNQQVGVSSIHNVETMQQSQQQAGAAMNEGAISNRERYAPSGDDAGGKAELMKVVSIMQFIQPPSRQSDPGEPVGGDVVTTAADKPSATPRAINPQQSTEKTLTAASPLTAAVRTPTAGVNLNTTMLQHSARKMSSKMNPTPKVHPKTPSKQQDGVQGTPHSFSGGCSPLHGIGALVPSPFSPRGFAPISSPRAQQRHTNNTSIAPNAVVAAHTVPTTPPSTSSRLLNVPSLLRLESLHALSQADADAQIAHLKSLVATLAQEKEGMLAREKESMLKEAATIREKALLREREEANAGALLPRQNWAFQTRPEIQVMSLVPPRPPGLHKHPCSPTKQSAPVHMSPVQATTTSHLFQAARNLTPLHTSRLSLMPTLMAAGTTASLVNDNLGKKCMVNCRNVPVLQLGLPCPSPPTPAPASPPPAAGKLGNSAWVFPMSSIAHVPHSPRA